MLHLFKKNVPKFFSQDEQNAIVEAIRATEKRTSGEVRVFIESKCRFMNAIDRAEELFYKLQMQHTQNRNGVLIYVALKHHQFALYADKGVYEKTGKDYWTTQASAILKHFHKGNYSAGIVEIIEEIGNTLSKYFPYDAATNKNELPDDIVFGK
ncbi:MAG: TPM domain-containing protein [Chitinophagaceae bacterium]|jgi:uncharacterized membrane protein|nr:TPM domain-containing protein [Chitinophagaceae bacterium]